MSMQDSTRLEQKTLCHGTRMPLLDALAPHEHICTPPTAQESLPEYHPKPTTSLPSCTCCKQEHPHTTKPGVHEWPFGTHNACRDCTSTHQHLCKARAGAGPCVVETTASNNNRACATAMMFQLCCVLCARRKAQQHCNMAASG
jgi:hypothetical protein